MHTHEGREDSLYKDDSPPIPPTPTPAATPVVKTGRSGSGLGTRFGVGPSPPEPITEEQALEQLMSIPLKDFEAFQRKVSREVEPGTVY